jgi:signal peptide peptidase SppA
MIKLDFKKNLIAVIVIVILIASFIIIKDEISYQLGYYDEQVYCPIMGIELHGEMTTYNIAPEEDEEGLVTNSTSADDVVWAIRDADLNPDVLAIILEIDSYGGSGVAGDEIATALQEAEKPTIAIIRDGATSAAYWAATGADYIIASPISDVGGIGITASYLDYTKQNQQDGITYIDLSSAKFKNMGDPDKIITEEERILWQRDLDIMHQYFIEQVANNRGLEINKVKELSDGSTMMGQMALDNGLIDKLGGTADVMEYLTDIGVIYYEEDLCWYL